MSWLSSAIKNVKKKVTIKGAISAVNSVTKGLPIVGSAIGALGGALAKAKENAAQASADVQAAGGVGGVIGNINQAAEDASKMSKYVLYGGLALGAILIFMIVRK